MNIGLATEPLAATTPYSSKASVSIHLLGQFKLEIEGGDQTQLLAYDKVKLMLAILGLAQGRSVQRARLATMLWPDSQEDQGRARVRHALHTLRQALTAVPDALIADATAISLCSRHTWVDVLSILDESTPDDVTNLRNRLETYTGPLLEDIKLPASDALLSWHHSWNAQLELELTQCRHKLIDAYLANSDTQTALTYAKWWVDRWPEDETCHRLLIRLLILTGNREAAMLAFQHCCDVLNKRLGVLPDAETRSLLGLENQALSTGSLVESSKEDQSYCPIATLAIALAWNRDGQDHHSHDNHESEDALLAMQTWHERLLALTAEYGAWLPNQGSTTILAHFGYPSLSERPITKAAHLAQAIASLDTPPEISMGLALHANIALITGGNELSLSTLFCQNVVPLAWQAKHGQILLSPSAAARMSDWPVQVHQGENHTYFSLSLTPDHASGTRMHGRLTEFDTLIQQWTRHRKGQPPILINLHGLPGLGKSQLAQAMANYVRHINGRVIQLHSHENQDDIPLHALQHWLREQLQLSTSTNVASWPADTYEQVQEAMREKLQISAIDSQTLINAFSVPPTQATAQVYEAAIEVALSMMQAGNPTSQPILVTWDNTQWMDSASKQLLSRMAQARAITMVLSTSRRPETASENIQHITLEPLTGKAIAELVSHKAKHVKLNRKLKADIVSDSTGIPLYAQEMMHMAYLGLRLDSIPRLTDFLAAHLLRGSTLTRNVALLLGLLPHLDVQVASQMLDVKKDDVRRSLDILLNLGVAHRNDQGSYVCHRMIARSLRLITRRNDKKILCTNVAAYLIKHRECASVVAQHLDQAESAETGMWWQKAIKEALLQGSLDQATNYMAHALASGKYISDQAQRQQFEFECNVTLGTLTTALEGPAAPKSILAYQRAAQAQSASTPDTTMTVLWSQWVVQHNLGNLAAGMHVAQKLLHTANAHKHEAWYGWAQYALAQYDLWKGNPADSETLLLQSLTAISQSTKTIDIASAFGKHSYSLGYAALGLSQAMQGRYSVALQNINHAIQMAQRNNSVTSVTACQLHLLRVYYLANNMPSVQAIGADITANLLEHTPSNNVWWSIAQSYALLPKLLSTPAASTLEQLQGSLSIIQNNMPLVTDSYLCLLARGQIAMGSPHTAIALLDDAAAIGHARQSWLLVPEIHCIRGDAWLAMDRPDIARQEWRAAQERAQHSTMHAYNAWATDRLATLGA